jgi:hypothetical protein
LLLVLEVVVEILVEVEELVVLEQVVYQFVEQQVIQL